MNDEMNFLKQHIKEDGDIADEEILEFTNMMNLLMCGFWIEQPED